MDTRMRELLFLVASALALAAPTLGWVRSVGSRASTQAAAADVELLVKQALEDRLAAKNLPHGDLLGDATLIAIQQDMPRADLKLSQGALPRLDGYEFYFISRAVAQSEASKTGQRHHFITVDQPTISESTATVWLGVDLVAPRELKILRCCRGLGQFRRAEGRWIFVKWLDMICS